MKKKIFLLILINLFLVSIFSSCDSNNEPIKLDTPVVSVSKSGLASWTEDDNATEYMYKINGSKEIPTYELSIQLSEGDRLVVKAVGDNVNYIDSDYSKEVTYSYPIGLKIQDEYNSLIAGTTTKHTEWSFTGEILDMTSTKFNDTYQSYNVRLILDVDGVLIGIYDGQVNGSYPVDISGLEVGTKVTVVGTIEERYTLTSGEYTASIEFSKPNITWVKKDDNNNEDINSTGAVNFVMINDTHGAFVDSSDAVSIGRVDTLIDELTQRNGKYIKIHNGDAFQGSYVSGKTYGLPLIESFNKMDFDCFVLGNHEFDWGIDKIAQYKDGDYSNGEADFPFLGANIFYKGTTTRPDWIDAYTIVNYGDIQVGIIGVIGEDQESSILTRYVSDYEFVNSVSLIEKYSKELRTELGCEVVVVATHDYDSGFNNSIASLSNNSKIDAIFCAHTHQFINESVVRSDKVSIPVVQNYHKNNRAVEVMVLLDSSNQMVSYTTNSYAPSKYGISNDIKEIINKYSKEIEESNEVLGSVSSNISKSKLGSYATDAMIEYIYNEEFFDGEIDIAIMNTGGIRSTIDSGEITKADVFEVFPFNNQVVLVNMSGKLIKSLCSKNSKYLYIDVADSIGSYNNLNDNTIYQLAVIDYVFEGTYYYQFDYLDEDDYIETNIIMRDILIEYIDNLY